jgi:hypothetical protein
MARVQRFILVCFAASLLLVSACTPLHSSLKPPYLLNGTLVSGPDMQKSAAAQCAQQNPGRALPPHPFTTDGCTLWPNGTWEECCVQHDVAYWCGGPRRLRRAADRQLHACIADHGGRLNGMVMFLGVRVGGTSWLPTPWRWGYGFDWLRPRARLRADPVHVPRLPAAKSSLPQ